MKGGLCETCLDPGHCCRSVFLSGSGFELPMSHERAEHLGLAAGLPFRPQAQFPDGRWKWECMALGADGRCGVYEDRPQLCRDYAAGSDPLCVHHQPEPEAMAA